jgi:hypothetical protein
MLYFGADHIAAGLRSNRWQALGDSTGHSSFSLTSGPAGMTGALMLRPFVEETVRKESARDRGRVASVFGVGAVGVGRDDNG